MYVKYRHIQMHGGRMDKMGEERRLISPLCDDVVNQTKRMEKNGKEYNDRLAGVQRSYIPQRIFNLVGRQRGVVVLFQHLIHKHISPRISIFLNFYDKSTTHTCSRYTTR